MKKPWTVLPLWLATTGCQTLLGIGPTESARDAGVESDLAPTPEGPWSCVGHVDLDEQNSAAIPVELPVYDVETYATPPGLSVMVCRPLSCSDPVAGPLTASDAGTVQLSLPGDFTGYLTVQSATTIPGIVQIIRPVAKMAKIMPVELVGPLTVATVAAMLATHLDSSRGMLLLQALDCWGNRGVGVTFELDESPTQPTSGVQDFYFVNQVPIITKTGTDVSGGGGIVNVPTGFVTVRARDVATGQVLASFPAEVRAGWITYVTVEPQ